MLGVNPLHALHVPLGQVLRSLIEDIRGGLRARHGRAIGVTSSARKLKILRSKASRIKRYLEYHQWWRKKGKKLLLQGQATLPASLSGPTKKSLSAPRIRQRHGSPPPSPASQVLQNRDLVYIILHHMKTSSPPLERCSFLANTALVSRVFNLESVPLLYRDIVVRGPASNALHHRNLIYTRIQSNIHTTRSLCIAYQGHTLELYDVLGGLEHTHKWHTLVLDLRQILSYKARIQGVTPDLFKHSSNPPPAMHAGGLAKKRFRHLKDLTILQGRGSRSVDLTPEGAVEEPLRFELERLSIGAPNQPWLDGCPVLLISIFVTSAQTLTLLVLDYPDDHPILEHFNLFLPLVKDNLRVLEFAGDFLPSIAECVAELDIKLSTFKASKINNLELITLLHPTGGLPPTLTTLSVPPYYLPDTHRTDSFGKGNEEFRGDFCEIVGSLHNTLDGPRGHTLKALELTFVPGAPKNRDLLRSLKRKCKTQEIKVITTLL